MEIKSATFEAWHCQNCYPDINRNSIHLRVYRNSSERFKQCPICREVTMTKSSTRTLQKATTQQEGRELITYTCHCCHKKEEKITIIPQQESTGCGGCSM